MKPVAALAVVVALLAAVWAVAEEARNAKGPVLDAVSAATRRYEPVAFASHDKHAQGLKIDCLTCHHEMGAADSAVRKCGSCHDAPGAKTPYVDAMHASCRGCHEKHVKDHPASKAPTACGSCHPERK
jgi:hypothetical protein